MPRQINQRELRNESGEIMRALARGERFIVMRDREPAGELRPLRASFVSRDALIEAMRSVPPIDASRFRRDVDAVLEQDPEPRA